MTGKPGKWLSVEQTARLAIAGSVDREKLIAHIVERLREEHRRNGRRFSDWRGRR